MSEILYNMAGNLQEELLSLQTEVEQLYTLDMVCTNEFTFEFHKASCF
ncbi:hypothetical protein [Bacillus toyonensis]|nr:hypothetical protein [Bacillus toyonensis]